MSETVTFRSNFSQHVITRVPKIEITLATGIKQLVQGGERIEFKPVPDGKGGWQGRYVARVGKNVHEDSLDFLAPGEDGDAQRDEVDALKAHYEFNKNIWVEGWSPEETRQLPRPQDYRKSVARAIAALDEDAVQKLLDEELATHGRGDLVAFANDALETIRETAASLQETEPKAKATK